MEKREQPVIILNELLDIYGLITALIILIVTLGNEFKIFEVNTWLFFSSIYYIFV